MKAPVIELYDGGGRLSFLFCAEKKPIKFGVSDEYLRDPFTDGRCIITHRSQPAISLGDSNAYGEVGSYNPVYLHHAGVDVFGV